MEYIRSRKERGKNYSEKETGMVSWSNLSPDGKGNPATGNIRGRRRLSGIYGDWNILGVRCH